MTQREVAEELRIARSMSREEVFEKMDALLDGADRELLAEIDVTRWLLDGDYRKVAWGALPIVLQDVFGTFGCSMFLGAMAAKKETR